MPGIHFAVCNRRMTIRLGCAALRAGQAEGAHGGFSMAGHRLTPKLHSRASGSSCNKKK
jgi:hypothetical protein